MAKVTIYFHADPSVGIFPYSFEMEVPDHSLDDEVRDETLLMIKNLYAELDGEFYPKEVYVND